MTRSELNRFNIKTLEDALKSSNQHRLDVTLKLINGSAIFSWTRHQCERHIRILKKNEGIKE